jgi:prepilin-type N-terminal cleavage/methylation domain-containing protein
MRKERGYPRGFTLLELVLVMVILTTVVAVVMPNLRGFWAAQRVQNAATEVLTLTRYARTQAVADGLIYRLNIDATSGKVCTLTMQNGTSFVKLGTGLDRGVLMPDETHLELTRPDGDRSHIDFFPDGRTEPAVLKVVDPLGEGIVIACLAPAEMFRIVPNTGGRR